MKKMGRPKLAIDQELFESLCQIQCTEAEIAGALKVSPDTILRWCKEIYNETFAEAFKKLSADGKSSLRRAQWKAALNGNSTMLIWMGKQVLGQVDKNEVTNIVPDKDIKIEFITRPKVEK